MRRDVVHEQWSFLALVSSQVADSIRVDGRERYRRVGRRLSCSDVCLRVWLCHLDVFDNPVLARVAGGGGKCVLLRRTVDSYWLGGLDGGAGGDCCADGMGYGKKNLNIQVSTFRHRIMFLRTESSQVSTHRLLYNR